MFPVFLHIDMNSYFASVEQQDNPSWRGKPVGVCEHLGGILIAASVEAKRWGIGTGTPVWEARKLYPKMIFTKTHPDRYRLYTNRLMRILQDYTDKVEQYSIDEAFMDVTRVVNIGRRVPQSSSGLRGAEFTSHRDRYFVNPFNEAALIGGAIKIRMKSEVGDWLTCSIGIAENKLLAKIASDLKKPNGLVIVYASSRTLSPAPVQLPADRFLLPGRARSRAGVPEFGQEVSVFYKDELYEQLKLTDVPGIGSRQEKRLNELGIRTLKDLRDYPRSKLVAHFGILGHHLHAMGKFESTWKPDAEQDTDIQSLGHMYTLPEKYREKKFFVPVLYKLSEMVARRMRQQEVVGSVLHFHLHDKEHNCFGRSRRLGYSLNDGREIFLECMRIFEGFSVAPKQFKLVGVTVSGLTEDNGQQSLFKKDEQRRKVATALDKINEKYGDFTVCRVPVKLAGNVFRDSIGFGRIKEQVRLASFR